MAEFARLIKEINLAFPSYKLEIHRQPWLVGKTKMYRPIYIYSNGERKFDVAFLLSEIEGYANGNVIQFRGSSSEFINAIRKEVIK